MKKIGIFGGTFSPFHVADAAICIAALNVVDEVYIVPTVTDYYRKEKRTLFTFDERVRIIESFLVDMPSKIYIDTVERDKDSKWRSIDTVLYFQNKFPDDELYFIMGGDSYNNFDTWFKYEDILSICKLIVIKRDEDIDLNKFNAIGLKIDDKYSNVSSTSIREKLIDELVDMYIMDKNFYS